MLIDQPDGNFTFIKSSGPFSSGCRAQPGYEVVHATFHPLPALEKGYELIARHLQQLGRPIQALCGMELRIPQPLSPQGFAEFNDPMSSGSRTGASLLMASTRRPRTNVALAVHPVAEPSLYGCSYDRAHGPRPSPALCCPERLKSSGPKKELKSSAAETCRRRASVKRRRRFLRSLDGPLTGVQPRLDRCDGRRSCTPFTMCIRYWKRRFCPAWSAEGITACAGTTPVRRSPRSRSRWGAQGGVSGMRAAWLRWPYVTLHRLAGTLYYFPASL